MEAYMSAIELAEDDATRKRYEASLKTTEVAALRAQQASASAPSTLRTATSMDQHWRSKLSREERAGTYVLDRENGLAVSVAAYENCEEGLQLVETAITVTPDGRNISGRAFTHAMAALVDCILLDDTAFFIPRGQDPKLSLLEKIQQLLKLELTTGKCEKYLDPRWPAKDIIADFKNKRLPLEGQDWVRMVLGSLVRLHIVSAFLMKLENKRGSAVSELKHTVALCEEGARVWAGVDYQDCGTCFSPTFIRNTRVFLLKNMVAAHRDAASPSAKKAFKLEDIEKLAKEILEECPESAWPAKDGSVMRVGYGALPNWEAYSALGFVPAQRAYAPLHNVPNGQAILADLAEAKKAAQSYDKAAALMPADWHQRRFMLWFGLQAWLRAGGLSVREIRRRDAEAKESTATAERFHEKLPAKFEPREFAQMQLKSIGDYLRQMPAGANDRQTVKAIPTLNMRGMPAEWDPRTAVSRDFWLALEGDIGVADCLFPS